MSPLHDALWWALQAGRKRSPDIQQEVASLGEEARWGSSDDNELVNATERSGVRLGLDVHGSVHQASVWERRILLTSYGDLLGVLGTSSGEVVVLVQEACVGVKGERV